MKLNLGPKRCPWDNMEEFCFKGLNVMVFIV